MTTKEHLIACEQSLQAAMKSLLAAAAEHDSSICSECCLPGGVHDAGCDVLADAIKAIGAHCWNMADDCTPGDVSVVMRSCNRRGERLNVTASQARVFADAVAAGAINSATPTTATNEKDKLALDMERELKETILVNERTAERMRSSIAELFSRLAAGAGLPDNEINGFSYQMIVDYVLSQLQSKTDRNRNLLRDLKPLIDMQRSMLSGYAQTSQIEGAERTNSQIGRAIRSYDMAVKFPV